MTKTALPPPCFRGHTVHSMAEQEVKMPANSTQKKQLPSRGWIRWAKYKVGTDNPMAGPP